MKNAVHFKDIWLMPNSQSFQLFTDWKKEKDHKLQKVARAKFEAHFKAVNEIYDKLSA